MKELKETAREMVVASDGNIEVRYLTRIDRIAKWSRQFVWKTKPYVEMGAAGMTFLSETHSALDRFAENLSKKGTAAHRMGRFTIRSVFELPRGGRCS